MEAHNFLILAILIMGQNCINASQDEIIEETDKIQKTGKLFSVFQVIEFPNDGCTGGTLNGTCYTSEECKNKGGTNDGTCASGYGVCCTFQIGCGQMTSENGSYIVQSSSTTPKNIQQGGCMVKICPLNKDVCRIRYDLDTFVLTGPVTQTAQATATGTGTTQRVGQCFYDEFSISSPGGPGSPPICGTNTGYHMIIDSNGMNCQMANFVISPVTTTTRKWNIRVTQYECGMDDSAGPPGCLQWYTQTANTIQNFAYPTSATTVGTTVTHLNNQNYNICIRRASGYCYICYSPKILTPAPSPQASFGLSVSQSDTKAQASTDSQCSEDYIEIFGGESATNAKIVTPATLGIDTNSGRLCGRYFNIKNTAEAQITVCSKKKPFRVGVRFDETEICSAAKGTTCEWDTVSGGIIGFKLIYWQTSC